MFKSKIIGNELVYYSDLIPETEHFFTTRNINVDNNIDTICNYLNVEKKDLIHPTQTHSVNVEYAETGKTDYPETDGLILTNLVQAIYLRFADCTPLIFYDKEANIGAVSHAGWRGTAGNIGVKTLEKILEYSNSDMKNIFVVIGPAIGECCYKTGDEVADKISKSVKKTDNIILEKSDGIYVDLKSANKEQFVEHGIIPENIDVCPFCTACRNDLFYSYRKENGTQLRHNAVLKLKQR